MTFQPPPPPPPQPETTLTHYKKLANTNFIGAWDIPAGSPDLILTIAAVTKEPVPNGKGKTDDCVIVRWMQPQYKPMILNATNRKNLHKAIGSPYVERWIGVNVAIYVDPRVRNPDGGGLIEGLRIRNVLPR